MALEVLDQIKEAIKKSQKILIVLPQNPSLDAVFSGLALYLFLKKLNKETLIVSSHFTPSSHLLEFLSYFQEIKPRADLKRKFIIQIEMNQTPLEELSYDIQGTTLNIYLTSSSGILKPENISTRTSSFNFDLVLTINAPDLESLGEIYEKNLDFFYHTPIVNIDIRADNESYGQINFIDLTSSSLAQSVFNLINHLDKKLFDPDIATLLLGGIIQRTRNFQIYTTPATLHTASELLSLKARREDVIRYLSQTKTFAKLKLWGRVLARLRSQKEDKIVWSLLALEDFKVTQTSAKDLNSIIDELITNIPSAKIIFILHEIETGVKAIFKMSPRFDFRQLFSDFSFSSKGDYLEIIFKNKTLLEVEKIILAKIKDKI